MFQRFIEDKRPRRGGFYLALAGGAFLEGGLVVGLVLRSLLTVAEVEPPRLLACLGSSCLTPLPPPRPQPTSGDVAKKPPRMDHPRTPLVQPSPRPQPAAPQPKPPSGPGEAGPPGPELPGDGPPGTEALPPAPSLPPLPVQTQPKYKWVLPHFRPHPIDPVEPHLPEAIKSVHRGQTVEAVYKMCVDQSGRVMTVSVVSGVPGADEAIVATLRGWVYQRQPLPICFIQSFQFVID